MEFTPEGLPPNTKSMLVPFWNQRSLQTPRIQLVHTNGASGIATNQSSYNWATAKPQSNTLPHYQVQLDGQAAKYIPTNRRGLDNATVAPGTSAFNSLSSAVRADILAHGQVRNWSIGIETSDLGYGAGKPGDASGFTEEQIETLAGILAYDSIVWGISLNYPDVWWGNGSATHTENFEYPYWTLYIGKSCPGSKKKLLMVSRVLPRANQLKAQWTGTGPQPVGDDEVGFLIVDADTGNYYSVGAGGISGVPTFPIRDALFQMGVISNVEPYRWAHEDVMALLNTEDLRPPS